MKVHAWAKKQFRVELDPETIDLLIECALAHYDATCRLAAMDKFEQGFLVRWKRSALFHREDVNHSILPFTVDGSFGEWDLLSKIIENSGMLFRDVEWKHRKMVELNGFLRRMFNASSDLRWNAEWDL